MKNLTDVSVFTDPVPCLEDGDGVVGGNSEVTAQALANRTRFLSLMATRAWAIFVGNGAGAPTLVDSEGVDSIARVDNNEILVTLTDTMDGSYVVLPGFSSGPAGVVNIRVENIDPAGFSVAGINKDGTPVSSGALIFMVAVIGRLA